MKRSTNEQGQNAVEYALVLPVLVLMTFGIVEFSLVIMAYNTISNAAREGARAGVIPPTVACDQACIDGRILTAANSLTSGLDSGELTINISRPDSDHVQVDISYNANLITAPVIAAVGGGTIPLDTVATMRVE